MNPPAAEGEGANHRPKILVVDDEPVQRKALRTILETSGYEVRCAESGEEAIALAQHYRPDLLLSDICMAGVDGFEAAARILGPLPLTRILFLSGVANVSPSEAASASLGHFELLAKPIPPAELLTQIVATLSRPQNNERCLSNDVVVIG